MLGTYICVIETDQHQKGIVLVNNDRTYKTTAFMVAIKIYLQSECY